MARRPTTGPIPIARATSESRRTGRVRCHDIRSSLGDVLDVSGSGMRVRSRSRPCVREGQGVDVSLHSVGRHVKVRARAIWVRKRAWRRWEVGLCFTKLSEDARRSLRDLARAQVINQRLAPDKRRRAG